MIESLLFCAVRVLTFDGAQALTAGSGFYFRREGRLFLVTSRHVFFDPSAGHLPTTVQITVHLDARDLTRTANIELPLYAAGQGLWTQAEDTGGAVDVAALEIAPDCLPASAVIRALEPANLASDTERVHAGAALVLVGFPLGFYDTVHQLPVVRQATVASAFGVRFQGQGYFLTDARVHRGASGAPVLQRRSDGSDMPWTLLGVHSSRIDMGNRDLVLDEALGLNCAWYADILMTLTTMKPSPAAPTPEAGPAQPRGNAAALPPGR